jgi:hypothetical protein
MLNFSAEAIRSAVDVNYDKDGFSGLALSFESEDMELANLLRAEVGTEADSALTDIDLAETCAALESNASMEFVAFDFMWKYGMEVEGEATAPTTAAPADQGGGDTKKAAWSDKKEGDNWFIRAIKWIARLFKSIASAIAGFFKKVWTYITGKAHQMKAKELVEFGLDKLDVDNAVLKNVKVMKDKGTTIGFNMVLFLGSVDKSIEELRKTSTIVLSVDRKNNTYETAGGSALASSISAGEVYYKLETLKGETKGSVWSKSTGLNIKGCIQRVATNNHDDFKKGVKNINNAIKESLRLGKECDKKAIEVAKEMQIDNKVVDNIKKCMKAIPLIQRSMLGSCKAFLAAAITAETTAVRYGVVAMSNANKKAPATPADNQSAAKPAQTATAPTQAAA